MGYIYIYMYECRREVVCYPFYSLSVQETLFQWSIFSFIQPMAGGTRVKSVTSFCLNENPINSNPFSVEVRSSW